MSKREEIYNFVGGKIRTLQEDSSWSKAALAKLRRGVGKKIEDVPELWDVILTDVPEDLIPKTGTPGKALNASFVALCLYAMHQQGGDRSVDTSGRSFATAARAIASDTNGIAVKHRFDSVITSNDLTELSNHVRGLIQIMKSSDNFAGFDYPRFAQDLYDYQFEQGRGRVRIRWGIDFYRVMNKNNEEKNKTDVSEKE